MWKYIEPKAIKNFFRVRDENNNFSRSQVKATAIQIGLMLVSLAVLIGLFLILWHAGVVQWISGLF